MAHATRLAAALFIAATTSSSGIANAAVGFELASLRSDGTPPSVYSDGSNQPAITSSGRYVAFVGDASNLVTPGVSGMQVYLRDRYNGTTELISVSTTGGGGNDSSSLPSISEDGCRVVFTSSASNLVAGDTNGVPDVFVRNRCVGLPATTLVSIALGGAPGNAASIDGRISADGTRAVFVSSATNLATATGMGFNCLYLRNLDNVGTSAITTPGGACIVARVPDISGDASRVVFWAATVPGTVNVTNGVWQMYLYDFGGTPALQPSVVSTNAASVPQSQGNEGSSTVSAPVISVDGRFIAFASRGTGLVAPDTGSSYQVYVKDLSTGAVQRASVNLSGTVGNGDSSGGGSGFRPGLSRLGKTVTFLTSASNLVPGGFFPNVVAFNRESGATGGFSGAQTLNGMPAISDGGDLIVANSLYNLDPAFASRGVFVFPGLLARIGNISTRGQVLTGNDRMIAGFIIGGSAPKTVVITVAGPSLVPFGIANALMNPLLDLVRSSDQSLVATNDDWQTQAIPADVARIQASGFQPNHEAEPAIIATLPPGAYTAIVSGGGGSTGVGVVGAFEVDHPEVPLINISTRGQVLTGNDRMIAGIIIQGVDSQRVVITVAGPSLNQFGLNGLANPTLTLVRSSDQVVIATNDDWQVQTNPNDANDILGSGFQPNNTAEPAIIATLPPGAYTAIVSGSGGGTGVGLVGVFKLQ